MANGIDWFRWHHGSVNDPKFGLVAKKAAARVGDVIAVWALVLELASANVNRGECGEIDCEATDFLLGADDGTTARILEAMRSRGLITGEHVTRWEDRQPKRERVDNTATERKRQQRERDSAKDGVTSTVTPSHATSHQVTPREEKSREEEKREEQNNNDNTGAAAPGEVVALPTDSDRPTAASLPPQQPLPEPPNPAVALTVALRPLGVSAMSTHPTVMDWADRGVSIELLTEAVRLAREHKAVGAIPPNYLAPIVDKLQNPGERRTAPRQPGAINEKFNFSHLDRSGDKAAMEASMARHGITTPDDGEEIDI